MAQKFVKKNQENGDGRERYILNLKHLCEICGPFRPFMGFLT